MVEIDTLFQTKTAKKNIPFGAAHTYIAYIRGYPQHKGTTNKQSFRRQAWLIQLKLADAKCPMREGQF